MSTPVEKKKTQIFSVGKALALCFYLAVAAVCFADRDRLTVEAIVSFTPQKPLSAALLMLALFALKGCTVFLNGNLLYAASGVLFPLPVAIAVNALGTVLMTATPFFLGRRAGGELLELLVQKYRKLALLKEAPREHGFVSTLLLRLFGILPCEPMGMYLGACALRYDSYLLGTMLGLSPAIVLYAVIGVYASQPTSPQFIAAIAAQLVTTLGSLTAAFLWKRRGSAGARAGKAAKFH